MTISDEKLVQLFLSGDDTAFSALVERYKYPIFQFILLKVKNRETASDLTQDVFVKLFHVADQYKQTGKFHSWLIRIAQNICIDFFRKNQRKKLVRLPKNPEEMDIQPHLSLSEQAMSPMNAEDEFERKEIQLLLKEAIDQLPEEQREAIILCHYHGLPYRDIAEIQECPSGTVKSRIHHALLKIKNYLEQTGIEFV